MYSYESSHRSCEASVRRARPNQMPLEDWERRLAARVIASVIMSNRVLIRSMVYSCAVFALVYAIMLMAVAWLEGTSLGEALILGTAQTTALCLQLVGEDARATRALVTSSSGSVEIIYECTAIFPGILPAAAVFSFPVPVRFKAVGLGIGIPAIFVINEMRLVSLIYVQGRFPSKFETVHLVVWPTILIIAIAGGWLAWASHALRAYEAKQP